MIFSDEKVTYRNNTCTSGVHFIIGNAFFYIDEVNVDGFTFNEEDSKILYETAKYKFLYGQEKKNEQSN